MLELFTEDKLVLQCTCVHHHIWQLGLNTAVQCCVTFTCLPLAPLQCQNAWSDEGILRCGCGMSYMLHVCL